MLFVDDFKMNHFAIPKYHNNSNEWNDSKKNNDNNTNSDNTNDNISSFFQLSWPNCVHIAWLKCVTFCPVTKLFLGIVFSLYNKTCSSPNSLSSRKNTRYNDSVRRFNVTFTSRESDFYLQYRMANSGKYMLSAIHNSDL